MGSSFKPSSGLGSELTSTDRCANALADKLAKAAAEGGRVTECDRQHARARHAAVTDMAMWIARATLEANHYCLPDGAYARDSQAVRIVRLAGQKRKAPEAPTRAEPISVAERHCKLPRLAALRERVLARQRAEALSEGSPQGNLSRGVSLDAVRS